MSFDPRIQTISANNGLGFSTDGITPLVTLISSGNLGIGVQPVASTDKLQVLGNTTIIGNLSASGITDIGSYSNRTRIGSNYLEIGGNPNTGVNIDQATFIDFHSASISAQADYSARILRNTGGNGNLDIVNLGAGYTSIIGGGGGYLIVTSGGNVGINTTTPTNSLSVNGNVDTAGTLRSGPSTSCVRLQGQAAVNDKVMWLYYNTSITKGQIQVEDQGISYRDLNLNPYGGNVSIGTVTPSGRFHVQDSNSQLYFKTDSSNPTLRIGTSSNVYSQLIFNTLSTDQVSISGSSYGIAIGGVAKLNIGYPNANYNEALRVNGDVRIENTLTLAGTLVAPLSANANGTKYIQSTTFVDPGGNNGDIVYII